MCACVFPSASLYCRSIGGVAAIRGVLGGVVVIEVVYLVVPLVYVLRVEC